MDSVPSSVDALAAWSPGSPLSRALQVSPTPPAREAAAALLAFGGWCPLEEADVVVALGGDGFMLQTLHAMIDRGHIRPVFGMNLGTVGFLMNEWRDDPGTAAGLDARLIAARPFEVTPLLMHAETIDGRRHSLYAVNEVSLLRETRQAAWIGIEVNDRPVLEELVGDGVLIATAAGSTAYNFSANGPILPLGSGLLALTPISPFRPRRWRGAILRESVGLRFRVIDPARRPVSAVADQREIRDAATVEVSVDATRRLTLLFDPDHGLDERITMEQFVV